MSVLRQILDRVSSAMIVAAGVTLICAGLLAFAPPAGAVPPSPGPTAVASTATPTATPSPTPSASATAGATGRPSAVPSGHQGTAAPTRVVLPALGIDLPVLPFDYPGGVNYPLCDVSQYYFGGQWDGMKLGRPGNDGMSVYIYGHARAGMFLRLLTVSQQNGGAAMIGDLVQLYSADDLVYIYEVFVVKRHVRDFSLASSVPPHEQWLVLQTSEGPNGTYPKLQVGARLLTVQPVEHAAAHPTAHPRVCG